MSVSILFRLKLGYIEFAMAGFRHPAIVNPAGQLLLTRRVNNSPYARIFQREAATVL